MSQPTLAASLLVILMVQGSLGQSWSNHYGSSSEYIHSNDTMKLVLSSRSGLHGSPRSTQNLEFLLSNRGLPGHFTFTTRSEDGFNGVLSTRETYLGPNNMQTITVSNMIVPERKDGAKVRFTLIATRDSGFNKREAPPRGQGSYPPVGGSGQYPGGGSGVGGSGSYPGGSGVGGSGQYPGGSGSYPGGGSGVGGSGQYPGGSGSYPGGSGVGGSGQYPGGGGSGVGGSGQYPGGSGSYPGGGSGVGGSGYYDPSNDPSNRREVSVTVEFTVTKTGLSDTTKPWAKLEYLADSKEQTCKRGPSQPGCDQEIWGAKFFVQDTESGIHLIEVIPTAANVREREPSPTNPIYHRYLNFPIGSTKEHEIIAVTNCCTPLMKLRVTDVAGLEYILDAEYQGTGSGGLSKTAIWGIVGGVVAFVLIVIIIVVAVLCKRNYSAVSQN